jgi:purine-nucleoside phosphorylase
METTTATDYKVVTFNEDGEIIRIVTFSLQANAQGYAFSALGAETHKGTVCSARIFYGDQTDYYEEMEY